MVAHDVGEAHLRCRARDGNRMIEALIAFRVLRPLEGRHEAVELGCHGDRIDHDILGCARVHHHALDIDDGLGGIERLVVELAERLAVDRVAPLRTELLEVEKRCTVSDLLIRHEGNLERRMRKLRMLAETFQKRADLGHACFVVGREECTSVGADDVLAHKLLEIGHLRRRRLDACPVHDACNERTSLVVHDMGMDVLRRRIGRRVDMGAEAKCRKVLGTCRRREARRHIGMLVLLGILAPKLLEVMCKHLCHLELGRRRGRLVLMGLV